MRFVLDMNMPPQLATWLRSQGHDAVHVADDGLGASSDHEILIRATTEHRIVVSFDLDFGDILSAARLSGTGVVLLRLRSARQAHIRQRLQVAIVQAGEAMEEGAIVLVEDARIRIRRMPPRRH
jgi:predicted nuclease of predicted toxin-antitoxin system